MSSNDRDTTRRDFLVRSGQAAAGVLAAGGLAGGARGQDTAPAASRPVVAAADRVNLAVLGIRSRGGALAEGFARLPNVRVKTLVDVDENLFAEKVLAVEQIQGTPPGTETDLRRAFDDPDVDAVVIATPDHWHALATIWACQAGKHVYVEKPCSHNIWEGRRMIETARQHDRVVAVGFQNRSNNSVRAAMKFLHEGGLGEIHMARGLCFKPRDSIGRHADEPVPEGVHYDLWLGSAPERPFNRNRFHYEWHWHWDYGCGDIGNQGPHQFDIARWGMGKSEHPVRVTSSGGYFAFDSDQQTPNTQLATLEYADGTLLHFEVRGLYTNDEDGIRIGNLFFGSKGWMHLNGSTWRTYFGRQNEPGPSSESAEAYADPANLAGSGGGNHFANFIAAVRADDRGLLTCDIEDGHMSTALPHLANIAYRTRRDLRFDGASERFVDSDEANALLTRDYRAPYVVPDRV